MPNGLQAEHATRKPDSLAERIRLHIDHKNVQFGYLSEHFDDVEAIANDGQTLDHNENSAFRTAFDHVTKTFELPGAKQYFVIVLGKNQRGLFKLSTIAVTKPRRKKFERPQMSENG